MLHQRIDLLQRLTRLADKPHAFHNLGAGIVDERLDFLGGTGGALRKFAHLLCHDRKTLARIARARGFDARIQGKKVGLEGDFVDNADNLADLPRCRLDALHGVDGTPNDFRGSRR
ncbi:hypothetical protein D3C80_1621920 [compost metagenome]